MEIDLSQQLKLLPESPGVYQFFDRDEKILYVGKAKNIKKRVQSYFNREFDSFKTKILVNQIIQIKYTIVETEFDALLLENNLIKVYQPKYNILLKDDKTYPWIVIKKEAFPRVFYTRNRLNDGSKYFGPYPDVKTMQSLLKLLHDLFKFRTCALDLSERKLKQSNYRACLEYHLKRCHAPCIQNQPIDEYDKFISEAVQIIKGEINPLIKNLSIQMKIYSDSYAFEKAQETKILIDQIKKYQSKSTVASTLFMSLDVFTWERNENNLFVNYMVVKEGSIIHTYTTNIESEIDGELENDLSTIVFELKERFQSTNSTIITNQILNYDLESYKIEVPLKGEKKKLIDLSLKNIQFAILKRNKNKSISFADIQSEDLLRSMQIELKVNELPVHIECFDNSNLQGTNAVSACVVFKNGIPSKKDYRHFNVKSVEGPDDFSTMKEVVLRRYSRMIEEKKSLPQLIIIDGGKGQLSAAIEALNELKLKNKIAIIGIAKKLEEIYYPGDQFPIILDRRSKSLKLIQHLRNEAHRFGITHHRNKRSKQAVVSELDLIKGIGEKTKILLMNEFKSLTVIKNSTLETLSKKIGQSKATVLFNYFQSKT